jgi:hypothetical protein
LKLPHSHAFKVAKGSFNIASGLYNLVGGTWEDQDIFFEFGRIYSVKAPTRRSLGSDGHAGHDTTLEGKVLNDRSDMYLWDFAVVGTGQKYVPARHRPFGSVAWRVWTSPFRLRFRGSWMHTHSAVASEMLIFQGDIEQRLPPELVKQCYHESKCADKRSKGTGIHAPKGDMVLTREMSTTLIRDVASRSVVNGTTELRCQYKSRNALVGNRAYVRSHYRSRLTAHTCEDWILEKNEKVSMLVLTYPVSQGRSDMPHESAVQQHHRWWAGTEILD